MQRESKTHLNQALTKTVDSLLEKQLAGPYHCQVFIRNKCAKRRGYKRDGVKSDIHLMKPNLGLIISLDFSTKNPYRE
jgi:hypothetical protein